MAELGCENCEPEDIPPGAGGPNPPPITIGDIDIAELDVTASGLTSVERCTEDCQPVTILICKDEDHDFGDTQDQTTDTGDFNWMVLGWIGPDGTRHEGEYDGSLGPLGSCVTCTPPCSPMVDYGTLDAAPLGEWHEIDVANTSCCPVQIVTSAGTYVVPAGQAKTVTFDCPVELQDAVFIGPNVDDCDPLDVHLTGVLRS